jgi:hypothetical protein
LKKQSFIKRGFKVKKSQEIFKRHGYEPLALKAHDSRLLIGGYTPKVACRVVAEELFQALIDEVDIERDGDDYALYEPLSFKPLGERIVERIQGTVSHPDHVRMVTLNPDYIGRTLRVKDDDGTTWYGVVDTEGLALMTRSDLLPTKKGGEVDAPL